jgi:hypothetical protein
VLGARLTPGAKEPAEQLLRAGPPFDPTETGLSAHAAYLDDDSVYLVFEGDGARSKALRLAREHMVEVARWQSVIRDLPSTMDDVPANASCVYTWKADNE